MFKKNVLFSAVVLFALVSTSGAQVYELVDLAAPPDDGQRAYLDVPSAVNDRAQVAGTANFGSENQSVFVYRPRYDKDGSVEYLNASPAKDSRGFGINSAGDVVGDLSTQQQRAGRHATLFRNNQAFDLGVLRPGDFSRANGINASRMIVGFSGPAPNGNASRAFVWTKDTGMIDIGTLGGDYAQAFAINDTGFVTGTSQISNGAIPAPNAGTHAFLYQPFSIPGRPPLRMMEDLGTLGGNDSYGMAINENNHVTGYSRINNFDNRVHAFIYNGEKMRDLGSLNNNSIYTDNSVALGINNIDQVVGWALVPPQNQELRPTASDGPVQQVAFLYSNGVMRDLNDLIGEAGQIYRLYSATDINNRGQIVAAAIDRRTNQVHAVLLTP